MRLSVPDAIRAAMARANQGFPREAVDGLRKMLATHPEDGDLHQALGLLQLQLGQTDQAIFHFERSAAIQPRRADWHSNLGTALSYRGRSAEAAERYRRALAINPAWFPALLGLSSALIGTSNFDEAESVARRAVDVEPNRPDAWINLTLAQARAGRSADAVGTLRDALARFPDHPSLLANLAAGLNAIDDATREEVFETHRRLGRAIARQTPIQPRALATSLSGDRPLRVGYLSPDFREHAVARFILPILANHDRARVETVAYSAAPNPDAVTREVASLAGEFVDVSAMRDDALDGRIRADRIDILVDLAGHTSGSRLAVFGLRPAPILVSYLGYPNTTGLPAVGFRLVDAITDPPGSEAFATEKLVRLPGCFVCYRPPADAPPVTPRPEGEPVTFVSFNAASKLSAATLALWGRIVSSVPGGRLLLKAAGLAAESGKGRVLEALAASGLPAERVTLLPRVPTMREHLGAYSQADIALDPLPYNGTTTTCEALHMGVPVVTLEGDRHASRVGSSLLRAAGLPELVATSADAYARIATDLARDTGRRRTLRASLRDRLAASPLCDGKAFARGLEAAYAEMWKSAGDALFYAGQVSDQPPPMPIAQDLVAAPAAGTMSAPEGPTATGSISTTTP
ncbi:MAG: tetratricopeptide repeat protein [Phycisphaerae bacterium]|nr:tetratricopeptide repeat protein [Phycisphaerae bacterium]